LQPPVFEIICARNTTNIQRFIHAQQGSEFTDALIADTAERKEFKVIGWRRLAREAKLSPTPVGKVIRGEGVRPQTLSIIRQTAARILAE